MGFECYRHGILSLYTAFNTKLGKVLGKTVNSAYPHRVHSFVTDLVAISPEAGDSSGISFLTFELQLY